MFEKVVEEIEKEAIKWVKDVFPNDEFKQSGISRALVEFAELGYNKCNEQLTKAKELIDELSSSLSVVGECEEEECELLNRAEQFLRKSE